MDLPEVELELRVQKSDFRALEDLGHKISSLFEYFDCDIERSDKQL